MAGEQKGEVFECLIQIALVNLGFEPSRNLFWGEKPKGFSIDPDFILGDIEAPTHWILATSSGSAKNSLEKFWRNVGEIFEVKKSFATPAKIINLVFESSLRDALQLAMSSIADAEILVDRANYGDELKSFVSKNLGRLPKTRDEKVDYVRSRLQIDDRVNRAFTDFQNELKSKLFSKKPEFDTLWKALRKENRTVRIRESRQTFIRRGTAKLMILAKEDRQPIYNHILKGKRIAPLPEYFYKVGYATKTIGGSVIADTDIKWVVENLPSETIEFILEKSYEARPDNWDNWIKFLSEAKIPEHQNYIQDNYDELTTGKGMLFHLKTHSPDGYKWLFLHLMEVFKIVSGKRQGYGYSVLSRDVGYGTGISQGYLELSDWVNGLISTPKAEKLLPDVAKALADRLKQLSPGDLKKIGLKVEGNYYHNLLESKVLSYWLFEPLPLLILKSLAEAKINVNYVKKHPTFIGEYLSKPHLIASPQVFRVGECLIVWRSAYDQGRHHKTKELAGRGQALRFEFSGNGKFSRRKGLKKLILVLDGTFTTDQIGSLFNAGWDEVFYPDEMNALIGVLK